MCCPLCCQSYDKLATHLLDKKTPCAALMEERNLTRDTVVKERREAIRKFATFHLSSQEYERLQKENDPVLALCELISLPVAADMKSARPEPAVS